MSDTIHKEFTKFSALLEEVDQSDLSEYKDHFFESIETIAKLIHQAPNSEELEDEFFNLCSSINCSLMHDRTRNKPLGYAGDFELIDWIYTQKTADNQKGKYFDEMFHSYEAAQSVRNRKSYFIEKCLELSHEKKGRVDVLNLACGSCRDVLEFYQLSQNGHNLHFHCIDHEARAIDYAKSLLSQIEVNGNIVLEMANVFHIKTDRKYDLIWSAGLFDYLEDRVLTLLLKKTWRYLKPGGRIIFGNFSPDNPTRYGMELVGKWYLIHRSAHELIRLCTDAKIPFSEIEVESEPNGINLFCVITK